MSPSLSSELPRPGGEAGGRVLRGATASKEAALGDLPVQLVRQWAPELNTPLQPHEVSHGSMKKVWWRCAEGHLWQASPNERCRGVSEGYRVRGCPVCAGVVVQRGVNDLATTHPHLSAEWRSTRTDGATATNTNAGSTTRVTWQCHVCTHLWETEINNRALAGTGCPACHGAALVPGVNSLSTTPEVAALFHPTKNSPLTAATIHRGSNRPMWWQCPQGHVWSAPVQRVMKSYRAAQVRNQIFGCPVCSRGNQYTNPRGSLAEEKPQLAKEWDLAKNHPVQPSDVTAGSDRRAWWLCTKHGHSWKAQIKARARGGGCPYCSGRKVLPGFNDLATIYPNTAAQLHPTLNGDITASHLLAHSSKKVYWLCPAGHVSTGSPSSKNTRKEDGNIACKECFNEKRLRG